jgi:hypothetical protein
MRIAPHFTKQGDAVSPERSHSEFAPNDGGSFRIDDVSLDPSLSR